MSVLATTLLSLLSLTGALHLGTNLTLGAGTAICTSTLTNTHEKCCASGMFSVDPTSGDVVYHKYVIYDFFSEGPTGVDSWNRWKDSCKSDGGKLLTLENRAEMNCAHYMVDQYSYGSTARADLFAIGLHAQSRFPGVYEWDGIDAAYDSDLLTGLADEATPSFTNWKAGAAPAGDNACVVMSLGNTGVVGEWEAVACNADLYYAICEIE